MTSPRVLACISSLPLATLAGLAAAQCPRSWMQFDIPRPSPRSQHAMADDDARGRLVLFGGYHANTALGDTWEWTGAAWQNHPVPGPSARYEHAMAFDRRAGAVILFGGFGTSLLGDTWAWDGSAWMQVSSTGPSPRAGASMTYDSVREEIILFGGTGAGGGETWAWNGASWRLAANTGPSRRIIPRLAFDEARGRAVLFSGAAAELPRDTWEWNGTAWTFMSPPNAPPVANFYQPFAYDRARQRCLLFTAQPGADHWEWDGEDWTSFTIPGAAPVVDGAVMAYHSTHLRMVSIGPTPAAATLVLDSNAAPLIGTHPADCATPDGQPAAFAVTAATSGGGPISYQWRKDGVDLSDSGQVRGAHTAALFLTPAGAGDEGSYDCVLTSDCGSVTSGSAALTVTCYADCDTSTGPGVLDIFDFLCFQNAFDAGCP